MGCPLRWSPISHRAMNCLAQNLPTNATDGRTDGRTELVKDVLSLSHRPFPTQHGAEAIFRAPDGRIIIIMYGTYWLDCAIKMKLKCFQCFVLIKREQTEKWGPSVLCAPTLWKGGGQC